MQTRRRYSREFKADAIQLVLEQGYTPKEAADSLGMDASILRRWIRKAQAASTASASLPEGAVNESEREELSRLRREVKRLEMERDILKKATAFFARESP